MLNHLRVTGKWKYLEALEYEKERRTKSQFADCCVYSTVNFEFFIIGSIIRLKMTSMKNGIGCYRKRSLQAVGYCYEYCMKAYKDRNNHPLLCCCT